MIATCLSAPTAPRAMASLEALGGQPTGVDAVDVRLPGRGRRGTAALRWTSSGASTYSQVVDAWRGAAGEVHPLRGRPRRSGERGLRRSRRRRAPCRRGGSSGSSGADRYPGRPASRGGSSGACPPGSPDARQRCGHRLRSRAEPEEASPFGLTDREHDILALLASGLTNPAIAPRLFISPKTSQRACVPDPVEVGSERASRGCRSRASLGDRYSGGPPGPAGKDRLSAGRQTCC